MEASTTSKPTMWGLTIAVTSIACSTVVSIGDRDTTEGCSIVIFWMAKTQMFNLRQVFAERRQILEDWLVQLIQRFESLYRRSRMIYQIGLLRSGVMKKKANPNHALFSKEVSNIFHIMFASSFESPRSHGSHWSNDPCRYKCRDFSREMLRESSLVLRVWTERIQAKLGIQDSASPTLPKSYQLLSYVNYTDSWTSNRVYLICIRIRIMFRRTIWNSLTYGFFTWILFPSPLWVSRLVFSRFRFLLKHALTGRR